ncbi:MAG: glycosyltransferase family 4 protein [Salinivirgaceae bacterium]|jgi:glycosyltransferase involved in cell wall biosynthesis|nr:glycosyltransferase family 4 protein [Salinivirgaceae bacterium]
MRVLHLFNEINYSGAEIMYASAASFLNEQGVELIAVSTGNNLGNFVHEFEKQGIQITHLPIRDSLQNPLKYIKTNIKLFKLIKSLHIDTLHIHRSDLFMAAYIAKIMGVKTVKTQHNIFRSKFLTFHYHKLKRYFARKIAKVTFHSIGESVYLHELNYYNNPTAQINNWYNAEKFYPATYANEQEVLRKQLGIPHEAFVVVSVGGCSNIKRHNHIITAVAQIASYIPIDYLHLGTGNNEAEEKALAIKLGIDNKVMFIGNKSNVRDYLVAADVFVMTSKFEGLGNVALEAMACKIPCILYNVYGLCDLINNNEQGFLIEENTEILAETIQLIYNDKSVVNSKVEKANKNVMELFNLQNSIVQLIKLYNK